MRAAGPSAVHESLAARIELHRLAVVGAVHDAAQRDGSIDRAALESTVALISTGLLYLAYDVDRLSRARMPGALRRAARAR